MNKINLFSSYNIIKVFFLLIGLNYIYFSIRLSLRENSWIAGDWLINYEGGILRRGLSGEILLFLSNTLSVSSIPCEGGGRNCFFPFGLISVVLK